MIFIRHTPLVWELADRILSVGDGGIQEMLSLTSLISSTPSEPK